MLVRHRTAGLLSLGLALSSCDPSPFDEPSQAQSNVETSKTSDSNSAGGSRANKADAGAQREQNRQAALDASIDSGATDAEINAGQGGAAHQGGSGGTNAGAGGSAQATTPTCRRSDSSAPVSLLGIHEVGTVPNPKLIALRVPGPISWIGGKLVWLFPKSIRTTNMIAADAAPNEPNAALLAGNDPTKLDEDLDPDGAPRKFLSADNDNPGVELWPTTLLRLPPPDKQETTQGVVFVRHMNPNLSFDVWVGRVTRNSTSAQEPLTPLFTGNEAKFSTGGFRGNDYAYLFACAEDMSVTDRADPKHFPCKLARAKSAEIEMHAGYRVYDPDKQQWVADLSAGGPVIFGSSGMLSLSYNNYVGRFLAVHSRWFSNDVVVQSAEYPWGPWREEFKISLPTPKDNVVQAAIEQSALTPATQCPTSLWISYLSPTASTNGFPSAGEIKLIQADIE